MALSDARVHGGWQLILRQLRTAPRPFVIGGAGATLWAAATVASAAVLGWVTDEIAFPAVEAGHVDTSRLVLAAALIVGVVLLRGIGVLGRRLGAYIAQYDLQRHDRRAVTRRYLDLPLSWHRRHSTGQLLNNAASDVESSAFVAAPLPMALGAVLMLVITAAYLVVTDPFLAAIGFVLAPLLAVLNVYFQHRMQRAADRAQRDRAQVTEIAHESFDGALVIKTLGREPHEVDRFKQVSDDLRDQMIQLGQLRGVFDPLIEAIPNVTILAVLFVGAWRVNSGLLSTGDLVQFAYLFRLVAMPMRVFGWMLGMLPRAVVGAERVEGVMGQTATMRYGDQTPDNQGPARIDAVEVTFRHPPTVSADLGDGTANRELLAEPAEVASPGDPRDSTDTTRGVDDVTLTIEPGQTVAIVGPTGSGKSTIASLLVRLFDPDAGRVVVDELDSIRVARRVLAAQAVICFQDAFLFDDTVAGNITLGDAQISVEAVHRAAEMAQADAFIRELPGGYETMVGERGSSLSGGQRQRIALARALVRSPRLLVLDDATSAVDPAIEQQILEGIANSGMPTTTVIVAYRRSAIALADRVVFVEHGRVTAVGSHQELEATVPAYAELTQAYSAPSAAP